MISLRAKVRPNGERFRRLARETAPDARRALVNDLQQQSLSQIVATTPVDTGRAKRGWESAASVRTSGEGTSDSSDGPGASLRSATNAVPYVRYLEYGTHRMAPLEIVRRALRRVAGLAAGMFSLRRSGAEDLSELDSGDLLADVEGVTDAEGGEL